MKKQSCLRKTITCTLVIGVVMLVHSPDAAAQDQEWQINLAGVWVDPDLSYDVTSPEGQRITAGSGTDIGFGVGIEYRISERFGLDFGVLFASPEINIRVEDASGEEVTASDSISFTPLTAGISLHLTPDSPVDLSVGVMLAYALYGNLGFTAGPGEVAEFSSSNDFSWGGTLGADIRLGEGRWSLNVTVTYLNTTLELIDLEDLERVEVDFDPLMVSVGVGLRF